MTAEALDEPLLAKLFACGVEGFGDAVGVEGKSVARTELSFTERAIPFFEYAKNRGGGMEADKRTIRTQEQGR